MSSSSQDLRTGSKSTSANIVKTHSIGQWAEYRVGSALQAQGWTILRRNFRVKHSEIDLIAQKGKTIIFVEVKFRRQIKPRIYESMIGYRKQQALRYGAKAFIQRHGPASGYTFRFDLALVRSDGHITYQVQFME